MEGMAPPEWIAWLNENVFNPLLNMINPLRDNMFKPLFDTVINPLIDWFVNLLNL
jgi:hypothetical protein